MPMLILAVVPEPGTARACLEHAALARAAVDDARLVVLHPNADPERLIAAAEEVAIQELREAREGSAVSRAAAVRTVFDEWVAASPGGGEAEW